MNGGGDIVSQSHRESGLLSKIPIYFCCPNIFFNILRHTTAHNSSSLFFPAAHYSTQRHTTAHSGTLQHTTHLLSFFPAARYSTQQHTTAHPIFSFFSSSTLQHTAAHYNTHIPPYLLFQQQQSSSTKPQPYQILPITPNNPNTSQHIKEL